MAKSKKVARKKIVPVKDRNKDPIYKGKNNKFYWKFLSPYNGKEIGQSAQGQGFNSRASAKKNIKALTKELNKYVG